MTAPALALIQSRENVGINLLQENLNMFQLSSGLQPLEQAKGKGEGERKHLIYCAGQDIDSVRSWPARRGFNV